MTKPPPPPDRLLLSILEDSQDATPLETLRRTFLAGFQAGRTSAASAFASHGGSVRSEKKATAVRENGKKGGRPKKSSPG